TLPTILLMVLYMLMIALTVAIIPFLSTICMDYVQSGIQLDFGLARGMGSLSYAIAAVVLGQLIDRLNPDVLMYTFLLSGTLFLIDLFLLPKTNASTTSSTKEKEGASLPYVIMKYKKFSFILLGFSLAFAAAVALSTYLINIVKALGGSTSLYGIAIFLMAVSEIPAMAYVTKRYQKLGAEKLLCIAIIAYVIRNLIIATAFNIPMLLIGMMFQSVSYGVFTATAAYYVSDHLLPEHQIMGQTFIAVMSSGFGSTIGNILGGFLQDAYGLQSMLLFSIAITILGAIIVLGAIKFIKE
ncbi:MAG: MFS transporter, partial [Erysipelotrichaceae bacterium]|nr:MFS transporter [Erysipelotrichaceae bacterium]